ncbi:nucleoside diphosphate phosphatase ENTPD5 isoform X2 [Condylostylus longicornis]|uniref:nucleoside diphosphate phosphatase ENTPD5 isoform X2 n=1 Tax=Condylostylus longicornis TaxID=2530218 RepID=UPI00244DAC1D|nr:nucleoside diphosphate phosphatase ENTPD5 isoform X2 [Condylostylus longicornis]
MRFEYELLSQDEEEKRPARRKSNTSSGGGTQGLKVSFLCLIACVILILLVLGLYMDSMSPVLERIVLKFGYERPQYAVVIDAGSTASRVVAFKFHKSYIDNKLHLDKELFVERKPGLSSFSKNPAKGAHSIELLLDEAKHFIPKEKWSDTPLVLKATAGLRLLPGHEANDLLSAVRELFVKSEFLVDENAVEIMDGTDEGIYAWFTLNLLLGRLSKSSQAASLDLGGGSTQVTFSPADAAQIPIYEKYIVPVHVFNKEINVFTHSYLGLGLMAVRHSVFTHNLHKSQTSIESSCVNPIIQNKTWIYDNTEYSISGKDNSASTFENPVVDFDVCLNSIKSIVLPLIKPKPITLKHHVIAAFSYFFERAIESGLLDLEGGEITVGKFRDGAKEVCKQANTDQPFMCIDLTYISTLLREGYGLDNTKKIKLYKKIDGHNVSWALGLAYNLLTTNERYHSS